MAKPIALITGDWHYHIWNQFNEKMERTRTTEWFIHSIFDYAHKKGIPIFFTGDMFHTPKAISTELLHRATTLFKQIKRKYKVKMYGIDGNHDQPTMSTAEHKIPNAYSSMCNAFPDMFYDITYTDMPFPELGIIVSGIPYITHNVGIKDQIAEAGSETANIDPPLKKVLLMHSDIPGAKDDNGREIGESNLGRNLGKLFQSFEKVFSGHIHKYQPLWQDKVYMVGAPNQQRKSDMGGRFGYMLLYDDMTTEFIDAKLPEFKTYNEGEDHPDTPDYWVVIPKAKTREDKTVIEAYKSVDRSVLAKRYIKSQKIKSRPKLNALINILNRIDD